MINVTVLFDIENQQQEVALLKSWNLPHHFNFRGYDIKDINPITELIDFEHTMLFVILIGISTKFLGKNFENDVKQIIASSKAILCFNINGTIALDEENSPRFLWDCGTVNMPFTKEQVTYSLSAIKLNTREMEKTGSYHIRKNPRPFDME